MDNRKEQLLGFLKESPQDPFLKYALVMEYVKEGSKELALAGFEELLAEHADYVGTYYHFGKFLEGDGQLNRALTIYRQGIDVARAKRNMHALGELQGAYNLASGEVDEDDDY